MECERVPPPETWEQAEVHELKLYRQHVSFCAVCRARVLQDAPDQLLFSIQEEPLPEDFWLGFWNSTQAKIGALPVRSRAPYPVIRWAAVFFFGLLILLYSRGLPETLPAKQVEVETYPVIEAIGNPEARYYIFQAGKDQKIIMVYDPDMNL